MALLTKGQVRNPNALFSILTDMLTDITNQRTALAAALVDQADQRVAHEQGRADMIAIRAAIVGITAKLDNDGGITDTNYAATWDPASLTWVATETLTQAAVATILTSQGDPKSNDPAIK